MQGLCVIQKFELEFVVQLTIGIFTSKNTLETIYFGKSQRCTIFVT